MKNLFVSHNCGITYKKIATAETSEELLEKTEELNANMLRWYIEDENGVMDYKHLCRIHSEILSDIKEKKCR